MALFEDVVVSRRAPWRGVLLSAGLHLAVIWFFGAYGQFLAELARTEAPPRTLVRVLELAPPDHQLIYRVTPEPAAEARRPRRNPSAVRASHSGPSLSVPSPSAPGADAPARAAARAPALPFIAPGPATPKVRLAEEVLIQPEAPGLVQMKEIRVPAMVILDRVLAKSRTFLPPPDRSVERRAPRAVALQMAPMDLRGTPAGIPVPAATTAAPKLPAPPQRRAAATGNAATDPEGAVSTVPGSESGAGSLVSLTTRDIPLPPAIALPGGSAGWSLGGANGLGSGAAGGDQGTAGVASGEGRAGGGAGNGGDAGSGSGVASGVGTGGGSGYGVGSGGGVGSGSGNGNGGGNGNGAGAAGGSTDSVGEAGWVKIVRTGPPKRDFVVTQSQSAIPGSTGLLAGRPVYSVYVPVGGEREWILQYCQVMERVAGRRNGNVVQLGTLTPLSAPYASIILRPVVQFRDGARYAFVHGFVSAAGRFERLAEAGDSAILDAAVVLRALEQWEFHPATKDGIPVAVEVLLCIPNV